MVAGKDVHVLLRIRRVPVSCCGPFRERKEPVAVLAAELGISESCLCRWAAQDDVDAGRREGVSSDERGELAQLRREKRRLEVEN